MKNIANNLYDASRKIGKVASITNDINNIKEGNFDKIAKKHIKREIHKNINKFL